MFGIVLVDDEEFFIDEIKNMMRHNQAYRILAHCSDGIAALKAIEDLDPDLLIADILMPGMSGLELARDIKLKNPNLPIVLMSDNPSYAVNSYEIGISGFLLKPLAEDKVFETLRRLLRD